jgi:hypothetical protein
MQAMQQQGGMNGEQQGNGGGGQGMA